jgi:dTDP-4-amino-4,6-dideoxy-D-galactose acyltransferase
MAPDPALVVARAAELAYHSPYFFLRDVNPARQQELFGAGAVRRFGSKEHEEIVPFASSAAAGQWLLSYLPWDTTYFGTPSYRLLTGLFDPVRNSPAALAEAAQHLRQQLTERGSYYAFSVVPAQDTALLQALTGGGWRLIETRLHFYHADVSSFDHVRYPVRLAQPAEAGQIGKVSAAARNPYDRFHADPWFGEIKADAFLARYAEAATSGGYADAVLVPDVPELAVASFLAIGDLTTDAAALEVSGGMSRVLLTAVEPANRGWHIKLVSETVHRARSLGHRYVLMTTQATNGAVFRTCEKLGFRLGGTSHVVAASN